MPREFLSNGLFDRLAIGRDVPQDRETFLETQNVRPSAHSISRKTIWKGGRKHFSIIATPHIRGLRGWL